MIENILKALCQSNSNFVITNIIFIDCMISVLYFFYQMHQCTNMNILHKLWCQVLLPVLFHTEVLQPLVFVSLVFLFVFARDNLVKLGNQSY